MANRNATAEPEAVETKAAEAPAAPPKPTAAELEAQKVAALAEQWPNGTLVEVTTKGSDYVGQQGQVAGIEARRGVPYVLVSVEVYSTGRRREGDKIKQALVRASSISKIDSYKEAPAAPAAPEAPAEETTES